MPRAKKVKYFNVRDVSVSRNLRGVSTRFTHFPANPQIPGLDSAMLFVQSMAGAKNFEELIAWQLSTELCDLVFKLTDSGKCRTDVRFCDQIRRASESAPPLIVEGFIRFTPAEFVRYLRMARGELAEVQSELLRAKRRHYFSDEDWHVAYTLARRAMGATTNLLKSKLPSHNSRKRRQRRRNPRP